jgi:hypothetical protein
VRHFVESLQDDIQVVEELPADLAQIDPMMKAPVSWSKVTFSLSLCLSVSVSVSLSLSLSLSLLLPFHHLDNLKKL